jgi:hypothetical protein
MTTNFWNVYEITVLGFAILVKFLVISVNFHHQIFAKRENKFRENTKVKFSFLP